MSDRHSAEERARRRREKRANRAASEQLKSNAAVVVAVVAGVATSIVKFVAASITGSSAMFSEGIHSLVDAINDSLLLVGGRRARREPDVEHPFGYGPEIYFYSHTVALVIFVLGGGFAIYEGMQNVMEGGDPIENPFINYIVLAIGIALESASLLVAVRTVNKARGDLKIMSYIRASKDPTNITVFLEDSVAVGGMFVALAGNVVSTATGNYVIDAWASVVIGAIMAFNALILLKETRSLVIGEGLSTDEVRDVVFIVESDSAVVKCGRVLSLYLGPEDLLMNLDVTFKDDLGEGDLLTAIDRIENEIMGEYPQTTRVFIEPESLNQVYSQRRDRRIAFEAYEDDKLRESRGERKSESRRYLSASVIERVRERREKVRDELARRYRKEWAGESGAHEGEVARRKLFDEVPRIEGRRVVLDHVVDADADALRDLIQSPRVRRFEPTNLFENQRDDVHETIRLLYGDLFCSKKSLILAVRLKETGELVGLAEFYGLREGLHKTSVGLRLRECWWGKGLASEATSLMVGYLYGETDIEIITASTMIENESAAHVLEGAGFIRSARDVEEDWGYPEPTRVDKWFC